MGVERCFGWGGGGVGGPPPENSESRRGTFRPLLLIYNIETTVDRKLFYINREHQFYLDVYTVKISCNWSS